MRFLKIGPPAGPFVCRKLNNGGKTVSRGECVSRGEFIDGGLDGSGGLASAANDRMDALDGLGREKLLARLNTNPSRHMLDDDNPAFRFNGVGDLSFF